MDNNISPLLASKLNNSNVSSDNNTQKQQQIQYSNELKQDTFVKSNTAAVVTASGVAGGGIIGAIKECVKHNSQPQPQSDILDKTTVNSVVAKFLNKETLNDTELDILKRLNFNEAVFAELPSDLIEEIKSLCNKEGLDIGKFAVIKNKGAMRLQEILREKTIARMTGTGNVNENIFKLFGDEFEQIYRSVLDSHKDMIDEETGFIKEYLSETFWTLIQTEKNSAGKSFVVERAGELMPDGSALVSTGIGIKQSGKTAAKSLNVKQVLKSAGIGAFVVGGLALIGSLIYNKVKNNKQSDQSIKKA